MWFLKSGLEREIEELYVRQMTSEFLDIRSARRAVRDAIEACKDQAKKEGVTPSSANYGKTIIIGAEKGYEVALKICSKAKNEGATEHDICEWWDLPDLCRRMVVWSEQTLRYASFLALQQDEGLSADDAMARVRKQFPMYGDPTDETHVQGDDRLLPNELRGRVDVFRERHGAEKIARAINRRYSTYNAFVRARIRENKL